MRSLLLFAAVAVAAQVTFAQGAPSSEGQTTTPQAASAAERAVQARHDKAVARSKARAAKRAASAASGK